MAFLSAATAISISISAALAAASLSSPIALAIRFRNWYLRRSPVSVPSNLQKVGSEYSK